MKPTLGIIFGVILALFSTRALASDTTADFDIKAAERFANLALACVHKEYPNKISHTLNGDRDVAPPRKLTPTFYGCYDWHSSVHGHWLLVRLVKTFPNAGFVRSARETLRQSLTREHIVQEAAYLRGEGRASFERPYGLAWLLQLVAELRQWDDPQAQKMAANLRPLEEAALERLNLWLPKLPNPVRIGEHDQTAFALGLMLDYARGGGDEKFAAQVRSKARQFYLSDKNCPLAYEPSGEDFLSPCLGEADVMRRVLPSRDFARWLQVFLPQISLAKSGNWLPPVVSPDPSDPKLAHLDGLNLSRAWMPGGRARGLTGRRQAAQSNPGGSRDAQAGGIGGRHGRALRGWPLAGKFCRVPGYQERHTSAVVRRVYEARAFRPDSRSGARLASRRISPLHFECRGSGRGCPPEPAVNTVGTASAAASRPVPWRA